MTRIQTNLHLLRLQNTRSNMKATAPSHLRRREKMKMLLLHFPKNHSSFKILGFEVLRTYHRVFWWLPLCPFLFHEIDPVFSSPPGLWSLVFKKGHHMQRYTFGLVFVVAATSSKADRRHFLPPQSINSERRSAGWRKCVDFTVIAGKSVIELTSLAPFSKNRFSLGLDPKWRLFWRHFPQFKKS